MHPRTWKAVPLSGELLSICMLRIRDPSTTFECPREGKMKVCQTKLTVGDEGCGRMPIEKPTVENLSTDGEYTLPLITS